MCASSPTARACAARSRTTAWVCAAITRRASVWPTCVAASSSCIRTITRSAPSRVRKGVRACRSSCRSTAMTETRVLIVDDEPPARAKLRRMLAAHLDYRVVAEADDVMGGLKALREVAPDLVVLDIALGAENGFDLLARAAPPYPLVVFATAYHEHALHAFEFAALDYLLKPFD